MIIRPLQLGDRRELESFFGRLPGGDLTFFKEDPLDPETVDHWFGDRHGRRLVAEDGDSIIGYVAVVPLYGWSAHVGEIRLVVDPDRRRQGVGRELARRALVEAVEANLRKLLVELIAEQPGAIAMFNGLGFQGEALLEEQVCDREGRLHDLIVLSHRVEDVWSHMAAVGLDADV